MTVTSFEDRPKESDVVKGEYDERVSRDEYLFENDTGETADFDCGQTLVITGTDVVVAGGATANGILITPITGLEDGETVKCGVIYKGPVIVDQDALIFADGATAAGQITALKAVGITCKREPIHQGGPGDSLEP